MNGYGAFAAFYDALTDDVDYAAWADYLLAAFSRHGGGADTVLDLACGSGSLSLELARRGCEVIGVDSSADMLAIAREKAAEAGEDVLFLCQDMRSLDLYGTVDGAVCMLDSLSHILHTDDLREIFRRLGLFIAPDGLLIFDVNTPYKHAHVLGDNAFVFEREEFVCAWRNRYLPATHEVEMALDFFLEEEDGTYSRYTDSVRERAYSLQTWKNLLAEAGFDLLGVYDERRFTAPEEQAQRWVLVAKNRAIHQRND
ncbi:MAG: methyltransferase domain-containing protein [Clostridia bacterium]|nr:methyltransferase domain-containing protein [Clostridia bacterium]